MLESFPLPIDGKKVMVKPNIVVRSKPEQGIVTHPSIVTTIMAQISSLGPARIVVGDNPNTDGYGENEATMHETGILAAANGCYENIGTHAFPVDSNPRFFQKLAISRAVFEADFTCTREFIGAILKRRPQINPQTCEPCDICTKGCPMSALHLKSIPSVENDKSDVCYCCEEVCQTRTIKLA